METVCRAWSQHANRPGLNPIAVVARTQHSGLLWGNLAMMR